MPAFALRLSGRREVDPQPAVGQQLTGGADPVALGLRPDDVIHARTLFVPIAHFGELHPDERAITTDTRGSIAVTETLSAHLRWHTG
jgi:hypothetical protein